MHEGTQNKENILREQAEDTGTKQKLGNYSSKHEFFLDDDGVIYGR